MNTFSKFYQGILPGNYFLTKSWEVTKKSESGTLWYLKKFLVLYYYIFLNGSIDTENKKEEVKNIFNDFINSLDCNVQEDAEEFFFGSSKYSDMRLPAFRYFNDFCGNYTFADEKERNKYIELSKLYYFMFLMRSGGQSGCKAVIREALYKRDFSPFQLDEIIKNYYSSHLDKRKKNTIEEEINEQKRDFHAQIRNERQLLFYLGYFYSKTKTRMLGEFCSLTPIGETALRANFDEFLLLWEHQKLKMISQPLDVDIKDVSNISQNVRDFHISYSPYLDILEFLERNNNLSKNVYQYILSRKNDAIQNTDWIKSEKTIVENLEKIKQKVHSFKRKRDIETEDFDKELKKYILGLRGDIVKDKGKNPLACVSFKKGVEVCDKTKFSKIIKTYKFLNRYKLEKYNELYKVCEDELRKYYVKSSSDMVYKKDEKTLIGWKLYNIHLDKFICFGLIYVFISACEMNNEEAYNKFKNLLCDMGINSKKSFLQTYDSYVQSEDNDDFDYFREGEKIRSYDKEVALKTNKNLNDLIDSESKNSTSNTKIRNHTLINLMKQYYTKVFADSDGLLKCECCSEKTFKTKNNMPFVEFHHLVPFSFGGPEHKLNIFALCPNCHRKFHYMADGKNILYEDLSKNNYLNKTLIERLKELFKQNKLRSYHLDFLILEGAINENDYEKITA